MCEFQGAAHRCRHLWERWSDDWDKRRAHLGFIDHIIVRWWWPNAGSLQGR
jgi:hypothetical protein